MSRMEIKVEFPMSDLEGGLKGIVTFKESGPRKHVLTPFMVLWSVAWLS